jgi:hypothetical protein
MPIYEVLAAGYDGDNSDTDDRVIWVIAATADQVAQAIQDTGAVLTGEIPLSDGEWEFHSDFTLPQQELSLSSCLLEFASQERNRNRAV